MCDSKASHGRKPSDFLVFMAIARKLTTFTIHKEVAARPLRSQATTLTDKYLLARLHAFDIDLDQSSLGRLCNAALSAEDIARPLLEHRTFETSDKLLEGDWIWICLDALWQRWFPDQPSFEMMDDKMQAGYDLTVTGEVAAACRIWLEAWNDILHLLDKASLQSIAEFDDRFRGTQSLFNWIQDLESELWNAGLEDQQFLKARIAICEEGLKRFAIDDELMRQNRRRALAKSHYELGETGKSDALYREWLYTDPQWGWGWIGWSDCYQFTRTELKDLHKTEELLQEGLSIPGVRDFQYLTERLANLYQEQGRGDKAAQILQQAEILLPAIKPGAEILSDNHSRRPEPYVNSRDDELWLSQMPKQAELLPIPYSPVTGGRHKIGRNQPCPCGSGRKFKKCCG
jgi:tetratricopeptide (TPR) repeat protein